MVSPEKLIQRNVFGQIIHWKSSSLFIKCNKCFLNVKLICLRCLPFTTSDNGKVEEAFNALIDASMHRKEA